MKRRRQRDEDQIPTYGSEADMCSEFISELDAKLWTPYPECEGWDILLVRSDGVQVGIQAKLKGNLEVLHQATKGFSRVGLNDWYERQGYNRGPDHVAVLVPEAKQFFVDIAHLLNVMVIRPYENRYQGWMYDSIEKLPEWPSHFKEREKLPQYVPDVVAGRPCPIQLTDWKIRAIKLCRRLRHVGYLTTADFKEAGVDRRRWLQWPNNWLTKNEAGQFVLMPGKRLPDEDHPKVSAQIDVELGFSGKEAK